MYICIGLTLIITTMAIVQSMWLKGTKKKLGGSVIYQAMGQTRQRELAAEVSNPRTESQMNQRVKWANLVNLYRANSGWMKYAFETKKSNQSEYNKFMSLNVSGSRIYLTKDQAAAGACVVDEYLITQGSLPSIEVIKQTHHYQTNIVLDQDFEIEDETTLASFSASILRNNPAIRRGDQISFILMHQLSNGITSVPYVVVREYELLVDDTASGLVKDYWPIDYLDVTAGEDYGFLSVVQGVPVGGFVFVLSRTISGRTYVSSQRIVLVNMENFIANYSSAAQLNSAISSYGESADAFLSSTSASPDQSSPVTPAILSLRISNTSYYPDSVLLTSSWVANQEINVEGVNFEIENTPLLKLTLVSGGHTTVIDCAFDEGGGGFYKFILPNSFTPGTNAAVLSAQVLMGSIVAQIGFSVPNEYFIEGME